ncbi:MAG: cell division protein ZapA [Ruminococcus sp.]|jgi:cell division protein ZapA|nr:cell division protein ZapA [Ruminococcus sp.]
MNKVKVTICGKDYNLMSEDSPELISSRARRTDALINKFSSDLKVNIQNAAVLAVLDIMTDADKLTHVVDNLRSQISEYVDEAVRERGRADEAHKALDKMRSKHDEAVIKTAELEKNAGTASDERYKKLEASVAKQVAEALEKGRQESAKTAKAALDASKERLEAAISEKEKLEAEVESLKRNLKEAEPEIRRNENEKLLKARNTELRRTIDNIRKENQTLKREMEQNSQRLGEKDTELGKLQAEFAELEKTNMRQTAEMAELFERLSSKDYGKEAGNDEQLEIVGLLE